VLAIVFFWIALFILCYGVSPFRNAASLSKASERSATMMFAFRFAGPLLLAATLPAQPPSLALSRVTVAPGGTAVLELSFTALVESPVAALEWTFQFPAAAITAITVEDGPAVSAARKTVICLGDAAAYKCLVLGANADAIADGVVAKVMLTLAPGASEVPVLVANTLGTSPEGQPVAVRGENGNISSTDAELRRSVPALSKRVAANR